MEFFSTEGDGRKIIIINSVAPFSRDKKLTAMANKAR